MFSHGTALRDRPSFGRPAATHPHAQLLLVPRLSRLGVWPLTLHWLTLILDTTSSPNNPGSESPYFFYSFSGFSSQCVHQSRSFGRHFSFLISADRIVHRSRHSLNHFFALPSPVVGLLQLLAKLRVQVDIQSLLVPQSAAQTSSLDRSAAFYSSINLLSLSENEIRDPCTSSSHFRHPDTALAFDL